ncbi:MAG: hypothetical protein EPO62_08390 [Candidatus Nitrosotenuis sp.]|nr:MAG: hypothetical protein EPO62_08390 [Candidatus Nitrosotenuis sp.]
MARRYLDRKTKERFKRLARSGEFDKHITEKGPKIQEFEDVLSSKRVIFLQDVYDEEKSASDIVTEQMGELCRTAEETSEYIKLVNDHLDHQKLRVDDLKEMQKTFETQMTFLTSNTDKSEKKKATKE